MFIHIVLFLHFVYSTGWSNIHWCRIMVLGKHQNEKTSAKQKVHLLLSCWNSWWCFSMLKHIGNALLFLFKELLPCIPFFLKIKSLLTILFQGCYDGIWNQYVRNAPWEIKQGKYTERCAILILVAAIYLCYVQTNYDLKILTCILCRIWSLNWDTESIG
jgi:hypothetical protein